MPNADTKAPTRVLIALRDAALWGVGAFAVGALYGLLYNLAGAEWGPATSLLIWLGLALGALLVAWSYVRHHWRYRGWYRAGTVPQGAVIRLVPGGNPVVVKPDVQRVLDPDELIEVISWPNPKGPQ